jgi:hypothetical protein
MRFERALKSIILRRVNIKEAIMNKEMGYEPVKFFNNGKRLCLAFWGAA